MSSPSNKLKVTVLGKGVVGKSSLTYRFIDYSAPETHDATVEDRYTTKMEYNGTQYEIEILDTAGEEDFQNMLDMWINFADGFLLVFAINDRVSFNELKQKRDRIVKNKKDLGRNIPILLVGNKSDLESDRQVTIEEAKSLAESWGIQYVETSAKFNNNCKETFKKIVEEIILGKQANQSGGLCPCIII